MKEKKNLVSFFFIDSFLIYVTWLPGKQLLYMSTNMTKINDGFIRINTWLDAKNEIKTSLVMSKSFCASENYLPSRQDVSLCRFISRRSGLGVLEADRVIQIISWVVGLSVVVRVRVEGHFLLNGSRSWLLHWFLIYLYRRRWWWLLGDH